jgi:hypothetical protein
MTSIPLYNLRVPSGLAARDGWGIVHAAIKRACVYPDRGSTRIIPNSSEFMFLFACSFQETIVENKIVLPPVLT